MNTENASFYDRLTPMREPGQVFDSRHYAPVPEDWYLAVSDIKGSTAAVETGHHSDVNFAAAAMIAALNNLCGSIPYQFGGDGAVALVPPAFPQAARRILAQTRRFARQEFKLDLRVGLARLSELTARGTEVRVGRYEPAPSSAYAVFLGDGVELMEASVKGRADNTLASLAMIVDADDDGAPPDLTGLSCRWTPKGLIREAKARKNKKPLFLSTLLVALETFVAYLFVKNKWRLGRFDAEVYRRDVMKGAVDFARSGESLALVFDCPEDRIDIIRAYLEDRFQRGELLYGMHISDHAVMTCLVTSAADGEHVHFVDGGDGGYTKAATQLKAQVKSGENYSVPP